MMESDIIGGGSRWLSPEDYSFVRERVPILCVDVLLSPCGRPSAVGLIRRATYDGGDGWCLVGGRVLRDEHLAAAVARHVTATLGAELRLDSATLEMRAVAEYFTKPSADQLHDPRKHAVALTYTATCEGTPHPAGEALDFHWFELGELGTVDFGFGQDAVVARVLAASGRGARPA
jgi:ADP-ribose pyrophosphatase YjhB (NUDIX family)